MAAPEAGPTSGALRGAAAFLILLIALDLWSTHHFDFGINNPAILAGVIAAASAGVTALQWLLSSREQRGILKSLRQTARVALSATVLVPLYVIAAAAILTVSTVRVVAESSGPIDDVTLVALESRDTARGESPDGLVRFTMITTPFGRPIRIDAPGYVPTTFTVYPLGGLTVRLGRDLPLAPSVLFRPDKQALSTLANHGRFRAWVVTGKDSVLLADTANVVSSFFVGRRMPIPGAMLEDWRLELECEPGLVRNFAILAWKRPTLIVNRSTTLRPGDTVRAEIRAKDGRVPAAAAEIVLGTESLVDFLVQDKTPPEPVAEGACR